MQSQQFLRTASLALLKRSQNRFAVGQQKFMNLVTAGQQQQRSFASSRPSPLRKQKLAKPGTQSASKAEEVQKNAKSKLMLVGANAVLFFGMSMWLLLFVDKYFQNRERECVLKAQAQVYDDFGDLDELAKKYQNHPALFTCMVRLQSRELKDLFPVEIGDVVDVLVEGVGRDGSLNICRSRPQNPLESAVGLFPMGCLQRVNLEEYNNESTASSS